MVVRKAWLRRLRLPLVRPYRLSYRTYEVFEPFYVELENGDGRIGFADAHISPGSSSETREGGWAFCQSALEAAIGRAPEELAATLGHRLKESPAAASAVIAAAEMLDGHPALEFGAAAALPLLAPLNALEPEAIEQEVEEGLANGYRCFKVKIGKDVVADAARVAAIQDAVGGRATLRLDANRAYSLEQALDFVGRLKPEAIELFEQPCDAEDWEANAAVASASPVPLMLDEPICSLADIDRAAGVANVRYLKLKLKRFGGLSRLCAGLAHVRALGMRPVLGDGLGSEIHNWMEAACARGLVKGASEFNGFLKCKDRLFATPLPFADGAVRLPPSWRPELDRAALERLTVETVTFGG